MPDWNTVCNTPKSTAADSPWQNPLTASWDMQSNTLERTKWMKKKVKKDGWKETNNKKQVPREILTNCIQGNESLKWTILKKTSKLSPQLLAPVNVCMQFIYVVLFSSYCKVKKEFSCLSGLVNTTESVYCLLNVDEIKRKCSLQLAGSYTVANITNNLLYDPNKINFP